MIFLYVKDMSGSPGQRDGGEVSRVDELWGITER